MILKIFSNYVHSADHRGTVERDNPDVFYDFRGKAKGCVDAAINLPQTLLLDDEEHRKVLTRHAHRVEYMEEPLGDPPLSEGQTVALHRVHSAEYLRQLESISSGLTPGKCNQAFGREADVWSGTYRAAITAVRAALSCVDAVTSDPLNQTRAFANVWPPGHHAEGGGKDGSGDLALGFCYVSNAAVAAFYARRLGLKTVVIDIDNHSGNGTRRALMNETGLGGIDLVYCSPYDTRRGGYLDGYYDEGSGKVVGVVREYPYRHDDVRLGTRKHPVHEASNILSLEFTGKEYRAGLESVEPAARPEEILERYTSSAIPWIRRFDPQLIIWSVGIDSAADDPLGGLGFGPGTYYEIIYRTAQAFPAAKIMGVMEGGYKPENWERCLWPVLFGLVGA